MSMVRVVLLRHSARTFAAKVDCEGTDLVLPCIQQCVIACLARMRLSAGFTSRCQPDPREQTASL